jgi:hypothetical protein
VVRNPTETEAAPGEGAVRTQAAPQEDGQTLAALDVALCGVEAAIRMMSDDDEFRPGLLQIRGVLLRRVRRPPLELVPQR